MHTYNSGYNFLQYLVSFFFLKEVQSPRFILSHFKYSNFPGSEPADCPGKFIYVARNPKDVAVSYFYHTLAFEVYEYNGEWNDFFTRFYSGEICEGDWFQHVLGWWKHRGMSINN